MTKTASNATQSSVGPLASLRMSLLRVGSRSTAVAMCASALVAGACNGQCTGTWTQIATQPIEVEGTFSLAYNPQIGGVVSLRGCRNEMYFLPSTTNAWVNLGQALVGGNDDTARGRGVLVWDESRSRLVCIGSREMCDSSLDSCPGASGTWELNGANWHFRAPAFGTYIDYVGAFDASRGNVVMHGTTYPLPFPECFLGPTITAAWDGTTWTILDDDGPAVRGHTMAYDNLRHRVLLFGGATSTTSAVESTTNNNLWAWDGTSWSLIAAGGPSPRCMSAMAYDPIRDRVVLHGGWSTEFVDINIYRDTWEFDGITWTQVASGGPQTGWNDGHAMVYDPARQAVVMLKAGKVLVIRDLNSIEDAMPKQEHPLVLLFRDLETKFVPGRVTAPVSYYFTLGNENEAKWTLRVDAKKCEVRMGKPEGSAQADCVLKTSPEIFLKIVREAYTPSPMEFMSGQVKSNDISLLLTFQKVFDLA